MSNKIENQEENINYDSKDIRRKDLKFNVREKDSVKFVASFNNFKQKLADLPLLKGRNKYITLGVGIFIIAAAITLPIVLPRILNPSSQSPTDDAQNEEEQARRQKQKEDTTAMLNSLDPDASNETKDAVISDIDDKIADSTTQEEKQFYTASKAFALGEYKDYQDAIAELDSLISQYRTAKMFTDVARSYDWASYLYEDAGELALALEYAKNALAVIDEAVSDPDKPQTVAGRDYYQKHIDALEGKQ